ncbi:MULTISPECIES: DUF485 domain-containing protein [Streptomyces]|uniref:DUF485 domain-containing protein n=1 Tax=Streptomyces TaxID=1883 RepID=UPI001676FE8C|nr:MULTISPECIES: DUF485 domain-containing protein [Streptomyces]MBD3577739.1 DUF485 domain-containing protein [Streptomyces sp. KD18]GGT14123.1 membrane protein [Streptomyces toxytricini]
MDKHEGPDAGTIRLDDPWYDALAVDWGEGDCTGGEGGGGAAPPRPAGSSEIYLEVQRSAAFQEVRGRYRGFVVPATAAFLLWYVAYVVAATAAPEFMARPVAGAVNVALLAGLGQFLSTFLLTWAYARHARLRRDRAALDLRWTVFEQERGRGRARNREAGR